MSYPVCGEGVEYTYISDVFRVPKSFDWDVGALSVTVPKMEAVIRVQTLDEAVSVSLTFNAFGKYFNPSSHLNNDG